MLMQLHSICPNMNNEGLVNIIARTLNIKLETGDIVIMPVSVCHCTLETQTHWNLMLSHYVW